MTKISLKIVANKAAKFLILITLSSCASLYTGRDLPIVKPSELSYIDSSITFRFVRIVNIDDNNFQLVRSSYSAKGAVSFISQLSTFREVKLSELPFESLSGNKDDNLNKLLEESIPSFETDYFVDVRKTVPYQPHGGGLGMWGGLISAVSLGVIPAWWYFNQEFEVTIYDKKRRRKNTFSLKEKYHTFSSTLFHLVPSAEYSLRKPLNKVEKNALINILQNISLKLRNE